MTGIVDAVDVSVEVWGGLVTNVAPADLPHGVSPDCQDVQFQVGSVKTRPGIAAKYTLPGNVSILYEKTYENLQEVPRFLSLDSSGVLRKDSSPGGALTSIYTGIIPNSYGKSDSLFGSEYIAFGNGENGLDIPRQYNDTNFDRVSHEGPGRGPSSIVPINVAIATISRTATLVGVTTEFPISSVITTGPHGLNAGDMVTISGVDDPTFNGSYLVNSVSSPTAFTYWNGYAAVAGVSLQRVSNVVTFVPPIALGIEPGDSVYITGATDSSFDGEFTITAGGYNYNQTGPDATAGSANLYWLFPWGGNVFSGVVAGGVATLGYTVTVPASPPGTFQPVPAVGQTIYIDGIAYASLAGIQTITAVPSDGIVQFSTGASDETLGVGATIQSYLPAATGSGGTVSPMGNVDAGVHQCVVIFVTRTGSYTKPSPPIYFAAAGGQQFTVSGIPIGDPTVIARVLSFTAANQASFYHLGPTGLTLPNSNMFIADNTTTETVINFSDQILLLGTLDDPLFNQIVLPPVSGTIGYSSRLFHWGEQANIQSLLALGFDGGFTNLTSATTGSQPNVPLGWTQVFSDNSGGSANVGIVTGNISTTGPQPVVFGDAYEIVGDGVTAIVGKITQGAAVNYLGNPNFQQNTAYGIRARVMSKGGTIGNLNVNLQSTSQAFTTAGIQAVYDSLGLYTVVTGILTMGMAMIPDDLLLQVYASGTPVQDSIVVVDNIEIYPLNQQFNNSNLRASFAQLATQGQESYDAITGLIQYNLNDGQSIRSCFKIRERLYIVKEHSFGVTQDDGVNEPSFWAVNDVSKTVGTPSVNGIGIGEDWAVIAHRTGLYLFWGGEVLKISEEIQPTWDQIDWSTGYAISVIVDTKKRRILICAPFFGEFAEDETFKTLVLDYHDVGSDAEAISGNPPIHLTYTGNKKAFDRARKWCPWTIEASSIAQIELSNGETGIYFGSNDDSGNINVLDRTGLVFTDNGAQIPSYYTTAFWVEQIQEQPLQLGSHRKLFTYLTFFCQGSGQLALTVYLASLSNGMALNSQSLVDPATYDIEMTVNQETERMALKFANSGVGQYFDMQRMTLNVKKHPWSSVRGVNL